MLVVEFADLEIGSAAERYRTSMAKDLPKPFRTLYGGGRVRAVNGFTSSNAAINEIERHRWVMSGAEGKAVRLRLVCSFALAQVQRELAEIVATPTRISLYGDGERCGYPEECRLCYNLPMLQGGYLRGADHDKKHSYQSCCPYSLSTSASLAAHRTHHRHAMNTDPRGCVSGRLDGRRE